MTVAELIKTLSSMPQDADIEMNISEGGIYSTIEPNWIYYEKDINTVILDYA